MVAAPTMFPKLNLYISEFSESEAVSKTAHYGEKLKVDIPDKECSQQYARFTSDYS
jgi:hypothetical protein